MWAKDLKSKNLILEVFDKNALGGYSKMRYFEHNLRHPGGVELDQKVACSTILGANSTPPGCLKSSKSSISAFFAHTEWCGPHGVCAGVYGAWLPEAPFLHFRKCAVFCAKLHFLHNFFARFCAKRRMQRRPLFWGLSPQKKVKNVHFTRKCTFS